MSGNGTNDSVLGKSTEIPKADLYAVCTIYAFISFTSVIGNGLVLAAFFKSSKIRYSRTNYLIVSLSFADLVSGCFAIPIYTYFMTINFKGYNNDPWYFFYQFTDILSVTASVWHLAFISLERYFAIVWPVIHHVATPATYFITIALLWFVAVVSGGLSLELYKYGLQYTIYNTASLFGLPLIIIVFSYVSIIRTTVLRSYVTSRRTFDRELKVCFTIVILIALFIVCWTPFFIMSTYSATCSCVSRQLFIYFKALHFAGSCVNPFVYASRIPDFRDAFTKILPKTLVSLVFCLLRKKRNSPPSSRIRASSTLSSTVGMVDTTKDKRRRPTLLENKTALEQLPVGENEPVLADSVPSNKSVTFLSDSP